MAFARTVRLACLLAVVVAWVSAWGPTGPSAAPPRKNVLVLLGDTVRADRMSLYGHERPTTPRIDRFAERGVVYDRALSAGVWTLPSHVSLFTGKDVSEHGIDRVKDRLPASATTLAEILAHAGYATWAFTANPFVSDGTGVTQGFQVVEAAWSERWRGAVAETMRPRLLDGDVNARRARQQIGLGHTMGFQAAGPTAHRALVEWLETRGDDRPFFAFINYMEAHTPRIPSPEARSRIMDASLSEHSLGVDQTVDANVAWMAGAHDYSPRDFEALRAVYDATLVDWDDAVGDLLDELERRGDLDDTIVVITADHGEALGEHERMGHQFNVHSPVARVPLVVVAPGQLTPGRSEQAVSTTSIFGRILELVGLELPPNVEDRITVAGDASRGALTEYTAPHPLELSMLRHFAAPNMEVYRRTMNAIERGSFRLVEGSDGSVALYDVREDPGESLDLAPERGDLVDELRVLLRARQGRRDRPLPAETTRFDEDARQRLRALGYIE